jgi:hypothetical protein
LNFPEHVGHPAQLEDAPGWRVCGRMFPRKTAPAMLVANAVEFRQIKSQCPGF